MMQLTQFHEGRHVDTALDDLQRQNISQQRKEVEENQQYLTRVIDIIKTLAKCSLPLRGHNEKEDSLNQGNFLEIVKLMARWDPFFKEYLDKAPKHATYLSNRSQNDLIHALSRSVLNEIEESVKAAQVFSILMDETADVSSKEQVMCTFARYIQYV